MPLEALRYDVTPTGLHYLLIHFDIPYVDPGDMETRDWRRGRSAVQPDARRSLTALPAQTLRVTHGVRRQRARAPQPAAVQPAVAVRGDRHGRMDGHSRLAAARARGSCRRCRRGRLHRRGPRRRRATSSRTTRAASRIEELRRPEVMLVYAMNGRAARAAARLPAAPARARLVRHDERQVADLDRGRARAVRRLPAG